MEAICCVDETIFCGEENNIETSLLSKPEIKETETVYNVNSPVLYLLIESLEWKQVLKRCNDYPQEIGAWVSNKVPNSDTYRWNHLPIHAAIVLKADIQVIKALVDPFPQSLQRKDAQGRLPCHLAIQHDASEEVLDYMIKLYPESMSIPDNKGRVPLAWIFESEEPTVGLRSSIAIYLNIERNKTKEEEEAAIQDKLSKIKAQYDESLEWVRNERENDRKAMEETIREFEDEAHYATERLNHFLKEKHERSGEMNSLQAKVKSLEEKLGTYEQTEPQLKTKSTEEMSSSDEDLSTEDEKREDKSVSSVFVKPNTSDNSADLKAAEEKIKSLENQLKTATAKYEAEIQDLKKRLQSSDTVKNMMKERLAKLTNSLVNIEYERMSSSSDKEEPCLVKF